MQAKVLLIESMEYDIIKHISPTGEGSFVPCEGDMQNDRFPRTAGCVFIREKPDNTEEKE